MMTAADIGYTALKTDRYERKFRVTDMRPAAVETVVRHHPALFREIYEKRWINNIYFDTHGMMYYHDNVVGRSRREKVRIRWYGELEGSIGHPILEVKIKNGMTGTKRSFQLAPFEMNEGLTAEILQNVILSSPDLPDDVMETIKGLTPTLVNRYSRKYFLEFAREYRLTIDCDMQYSGVLGQAISPHGMRREEATVVELKYDFEKDPEAGRISNALPFRMTKNSKYVNGIDLCRKVIH